VVSVRKFNKYNLVNITTINAIVFR
jgi:hypothetical protein